MQASQMTLPHLRSLSDREFRSFVDDFRRYVLQCAASNPIIVPLPPHVLMSRSAVRLASLRVPIEPNVDAEDYLTAIAHAFFSPRSNLEALRRLKALAMSPLKTINQSRLLRYLEDYDAVVDFLTDDVTPSDKQLRKTFVNGLQPRLLQERVLVAEPNSFDDAKITAVQECEELLTIMSQLEVAPVLDVPDAPRAPAIPASRPAAPSNNVPRHVTPARPSVPANTPRTNTAPVGGQPFRPSPVCHGCGHAGHLRPDCPHKGKAGFFTTGKRDNPLRLKVMTTHDDVLRCDVSLRGNVPLGHPESWVDLQAIVDTGASDSFISEDMFNQLKPKVVYSEPRQVSTANGTVSTERCALLDLKCHVKPHAVGITVPVHVLNTGDPMILGFNIINALDLLPMLRADNRGPPGEVNEVTPLDEGEETTPENIDPALQVVIDDFVDLFDEVLPPEGARVAPMVIELKPEASPPHEPPRHLSPAMAQVVDNEVEALLQAEIIKPSQSPYAAPAFVVPKADGSARMVIDYRRLNQQTVPFRFPLQNIKSILGRLHGSCFFVSLDLRSGYHQIPMATDDVPKTAFITPNGLYEYTKVPFGLMNAPAHFQRAMVTALGDILGRGAECYLDDIIVHAADLETLARRLRDVMTRLMKINVRLKRTKCEFGKTSIDFVGHTVSKEGTSISSWRKDALRNITPPTDPSTLRSFCGLVNYHRDHIRNFAAIMAPLYELCGKNQFVWGDRQQEAFDQIKSEVIHAPILQHMDYSQMAVIKTDASTKGCGAVLLQQDPVTMVEKPVAFVSRKFNETEARWATIEQEAYGIFFAVTKFDPFLRGHTFEIQTDHKNLVHMARSETPKVVRWSLRLQEYVFTLHHIAGVDNSTADVLSRCLKIISDQHVDVIAAVHGPLVGHMGANKTVERLKARGHSWSNMLADVKAYIKSCPTCQKVRKTAKQTLAALRPTFTDQPFATLCVDTIGPLPEDEAHYRFVVVFICAFTRLVELVPTYNTSAAEAKRALIIVISHYGCPAKIRSDQGSQFTAKMFQDVIADLGIKHVPTLPYRHEANGLVERANKEVGRHLATMTSDLRIKDTWSVYLPLVQRTINASTHSATGASPCAMVFGNAVNLDRGFIDPFTEGEGTTDVRQTQDILFAAARIQQEESFQPGPETSTTFNVGDQVLVTYPGRPPSKLAPPLMGPYTIADRANDIYSVVNPAAGRTQRYHATRLRAYDPSRTDSPLNIIATDDDSYLVEAIVDHRLGTTKTKHQFRVRWDGYLPEDDQWLDYPAVKDLEALDEYVSSHPELSL